MVVALAVTAVMVMVMVLVLVLVLVLVHKTAVGIMLGAKPAVLLARPVPLHLRTLLRYSEY